MIRFCFILIFIIYNRKGRAVLLKCSGKVLDPGFPLPIMLGIPDAPLKATAAGPATAATLNQLDVHSFLYAATYVAGYQEEGATEKPTLPPHLAPPLTTTVQVKEINVFLFCFYVAIVTVSVKRRWTGSKDSCNFSGSEFF